MLQCFEQPEGLQEGKPGHEVQVQSFRRRLLPKGGQHWVPEIRQSLPGTSHAKGIVVEKIGIEAKQKLV